MEEGFRFFKAQRPGAEEGGIGTAEPDGLPEAPGRTAAGLIRLGALLVLCFFPLQILFLKHLFLSTVPLFDDWMGPAWAQSTTTTVEFSWWSPLLVAGLPFAVLWPSLATTFAAPARADRILRWAFLPLSLLLGVAAWAAVAEQAGAFPRPWVPIPPPAGAQVPAAGVVLAAVVRRPSVARRILAADILWLLLLRWNDVGMSPSYFPGWVGVAGAGLVILGESLAPHPRRDS